MNINSINNQNFKGFVRVHTCNDEEGVIVNTSKILDMSGSHFEQAGRKFHFNTLIAETASGIKALKGNAENNWTCGTKLFDNFEQYVAHVCHHADETGEILDIQM